MKMFSIVILLSLIVFSIAVSAIKNLLGSIIVFMVYSLIMAIIWQQLNAPDLAITEAAVGAGITTILFILTLKRIKGAKK
ncbi:hydrogenase subunit MbhD domain-containing protein [Clostridium sp. DL1XJH146]